MTKERSRADFTGQSIYVGLDVHKNSWSASVHTELLEHKTFNMPPEPQVLSDYLQRNFPGADYHCVYEAGYCGFWPCRQLRELGIDCIVVNPLDVPTTHKERKHRRDKVDARKLARTLRSGELAPIFVPNERQEFERALVRNHESLITKRTRCKNQIKAFLQYHGLRPPKELERAGWSNKFVDWLRTMPLEYWAGRVALDELLDELDFLERQIALNTEHIKRLSNEEEHQGQVKLLRSVPGVGVLSAMVLITELIDINRFKGLDELACYVGLVPDQEQSGDDETVPQLTRRRNPHLRRLIVECAWVAARKDPALTRAFEKLSKYMRKQQAIIRIARKLLNRIRYVLRHQEPYVIGVLE
jgi:transposase